MARTPRISSLLYALVGGVALFAALALAAPVPAQGPAEDQYTPTKPGGGGPVPTDPGSDPGSFEGEQADEGSGAAAPGGSGDSNGTPPATSPVTDAAPGVSTGEGGAQSGGSGAEQTLSAFAREGQDERAASAGSPSDEAGAANLSSSDEEGGTGIGALLWIVLGVTLLCALAARIIRNREAAPLT